MRRGVLALATVGVLAALPASASAHRYTAFAGNPGKPPKGVNDQTVLNRFFPAKVTVHVGDKVRYSALTPHTVSVLAPGTAYPAAAIPDPAGGTYGNDIADPQGNPFFFVGRPKFINNPFVFAPAGSTTVGKDKATHSSGFLVGAKYTLKFAKAKTYTVLCLLHPGMKQTVKVVKKRRKADTDATVTKRIVRQSIKGYADAKKAVKTAVPANTVLAGVERKNATVLSYFPNTLTVPAGTTVDFKLTTPSEVHNMVWGPAAYVDAFAAATDLFPQGPGTPNQLSPASVFGSEPANTAGGYTYTGANYGNGFLWTPVMDPVPASPLPGDEKITFTNPGTYSYYCAIHGKSMSGTVVVQ
jgi:plastocyanin